MRVRDRSRLIIFSHLFPHFVRHTLWLFLLATCGISRDPSPVTSPLVSPHTREARREETRVRSFRGRRRKDPTRILLSPNSLLAILRHSTMLKVDRASSIHMPPRPSSLFNIYSCNSTLPPALICSVVVAGHPRALSSDSTPRYSEL